MASSMIKRYFCGHCEQQLSKTSYFKHKRLFYDRKSGSWKKKRIHYQADHSVDFEECQVAHECDIASNDESHGKLS